MIIVDNTSEYVNTHGGGVIPPCTGLTPDALPEVQQQTTTLKNLPSGVSTRNALLPKHIQEARNHVHKATKPLRFYYNRYNHGMKTIRISLTITDRQMESIRRTCSSGSDDIIL